MCHNQIIALSGYLTALKNAKISADLIRFQVPSNLYVSTNFLAYTAISQNVLHSRVGSFVPFPFSFLAGNT